MQKQPNKKGVNSGSLLEGTVHHGGKIIVLGV